MYTPTCLGHRHTLPKQKQQFERHLVRDSYVNLKAPVGKVNAYWDSLWRRCLWWAPFLCSVLLVLELVGTIFHPPFPHQPSSSRGNVQSLSATVLVFAPPLCSTARCQAHPHLCMPQPWLGLPQLLGMQNPFRG